MTEPTDAWSGDLYAANTAHHRAHDDRILETLDPRPGDRVLDVGCGVGDLTVRIAERVTAGAHGPGHVTGIDRSADMIATARASNRHDAVDFEVVPAQEIGTVFDEASFDRLVSVACLHWIDEADHPRVLSAFHRVLAPGGTMVLDFGGRGQIAAVLDVVSEFAVPMNIPECPWFFPGEEYRETVEAAGFAPGAVSVELVHQRRSMPTFDDLTGWLDSQVLVAWRPHLDDAMWGALRAGVLERSYAGLRRDDGSYDLDYVRCFVVGRR